MFPCSYYSHSFLSFIVKPFSVLVCSPVSMYFPFSPQFTLVRVLYFTTESIFAGVTNGLLIAKPRKHSSPYSLFQQDSKQWKIAFMLSYFHFWFFVCVTLCFPPALISTLQYPLMVYLPPTSLNVSVSLIWSFTLYFNPTLTEWCY